MQTAKNVSTKIFSSLILVVALIGLAGVYTPTAHAVDLECAVLPKDICIKADQGGADGGVFELLKWILSIMIAVVGIAAVGGMIWAGILYLTASDNAAQVKQAKTIIVGVAIGIIAFGLMLLVVNWLVPGNVIE